MKRTLTTAAAAAVFALVTLPATGQSTGSGSTGSGSSQPGSSSSGSGATDQRGSTHAGQAGTGQSGAAETGTSGRSAVGQSGTSPDASAKAGVKASPQDRTFIMEAAAGGMAEVELGRLASQKGSSSDVKGFGQMMVDDHSKANDQLMKIAQDKGLAAPHALKPQAKAMHDRLSKLSGDAFDRAYMQDMVKDHRKDVALFRKQSTSASDPEVKQFAASTLPTLEKHLQRAQEIAKTVGAASGTVHDMSGADHKTTKGARGTAKPAPGSGTSGSARPPR